ncbi:hypothetical protein [Streptomyces rhizosphaericus]|uniref:AAA+ ATPase domain-containing protein n=1 Tax=Streptomyces rhizosphaericus TaxID=114699 RepID=A0ABN1SLM0_9ACTN|nr:hypothetical protein [Streptomyces indonesiensis]
MAGTHGIHVHGDVEGSQVVVGDHNVVINAALGSSVSVRSEGPPPTRRRTRPAGRALPDRAPQLLGRDRELAALERWLGQGYPVQVYGPPGTGKSVLLRRYAADAATSGRDVVYLPAAGVPAEDLVQELFHACYEAEDYKPEPARVRRLMGSVRALLVIDDFQGSTAELAELMDAAPGCDVLLATAERHTWDEGRALRLEGLQEEPALALFGEELRRPLRDEEYEAARRLVTAVRGHPLTLVQAAADTTFEVDEDARVTGLANGLSDAASVLLRLLDALSPLPLSAKLLPILAGGVDKAAITELTSLALIGSSGTGYRTTGRVAHLVAERTGPARDAAKLAPALTAWAAATTATRHDIAAEAPVVCHVLAAAARARDHAAVCALARTTAPALARSLRWGAWHQVLDLGAAAARALGSAADEAYFRQEEEVRKRALGVVALATAGGALAAGGVIGHIAGHGGAAAGKTGFAAAASNPAAITAAVAALVVGGVFAGLATAGGGQPRARPTPSGQVTSLAATGTRPPDPISTAPRTPTRPPSPSRTSPRPPDQGHGTPVAHPDHLIAAHGPRPGSRQMSARFRGHSHLGRARRRRSHRRLRMGGLHAVRRRADPDRRQGGSRPRRIRCDSHLLPQDGPSRAGDPGLSPLPVHRPLPSPSVG